MNESKKHIRRFNTIVELDEKSNSLYIYVPPHFHKTPIPVTDTETVTTKRGIYHFDWNGGKLIGIEIMDADKNVILEGKRNE